MMAPRISNAQEFGRVAVLLGGTAAEREISLLSGQAVLAGLKRRGVDAHPVDPRDGIGALAAGEFDRAWIALHGRGGEDGSMQGLLSCLGVPFTGSGVLGAALSMDKLRSKQLFAGDGLGTPAWRVMTDAPQADDIVAELGLPLIVKPAEEGSSLGMSRVETAEELAPAYERASGFDSAVIVEAWVHGAEYTVSVLADEALPLIRIEAGNSFYDYEAKYFRDDTSYICPCGLPAETEARYAAEALRAFRAVGGEGWGRVDFMLGEDGEALFLEVNTVPGMTDHSLVPMAAAQAGIDFDELVWRILETSFAERAFDGAALMEGDAHGAA